MEQQININTPQSSNNNNSHNIQNQQQQQQNQKKNQNNQNIQDVSNNKDQNNNQKQNKNQQKEKEGKCLNWKKYLYSEDLLTDILKFEQWDKTDLNFTEAQVLYKDLNRTRQKEDFFKKEKTQVKLQQITTFYCKQNYVNYQQGILELVIPFMLLQSKDFKLSKCYAYFSQFMNKYYPQFLIQKPLNNTIELPHLTSAIHFCEVLLRYHSPNIYQAFLNVDMNLSIAATQWLITLFAKDTKIPFVYLIFDYFIKKNNPVFIFYMVVSLILESENKIYQIQEEDEDELIFFFNKNLKNLETEEQVENWLNNTEKVFQKSPKSFEQLVEYSGLKDSQLMSQNDIQNLVNCQIKSRIMPFYPQNLLELPQNLEIFQTLDLTGKNRDILFKNKKFPKWNSKNIDKMVEFICNEIDQNTQICLVVEKYNDNNEIEKVKQLAQKLYEYRRKYISVLVGGYELYKEVLILNKNNEIDNNSKLRQNLFKMSYFL